MDGITDHITRVARSAGMKVEIWSDVVCPWCYIGERRFAQALATFDGDVEVVFRPFQLDPDAPERATPLLPHLERKFGASMPDKLAQVAATAAAEGLTMDFDRALATSTRTAHRLLLLTLNAYGPEVQRELAERLFEAYFTHGADVGDHVLLEALALASGIDGGRVRGWLAGVEGEQELDLALAEARELGIRAVPTFVFDGQYVIEGGQATAVFTQVLEEVRRRAAAEDATRAPDPADAASATPATPAG